MVSCHVTEKTKGSSLIFGLKRDVTETGTKTGIAYVVVAAEN